MPAHIAQLPAHIAIPPKIGRIYLIKRREVNNAYVTKKSLKGESYIGAMMPTEGSARGDTGPTLAVRREQLSIEPPKGDRVYLYAFR